MYNIQRLDVSPDIAARYLAANGLNRQINTKVVAAYAEMMRNGQWGLNIAPICISTDGQLLNGQHRLQACIASGISLHDQLLLTNLPVAAFEYIDNGYERTVSSIMKMGDVPYADLVSSLCSAFMAYGHFGVFASTNRTKVFAGASLAFLEENPWIRETAKEAMALYKKNKAITPVVYGICHRQMGLVSEDARDSFLHQFTTMENLPQGSPVLALLRTIQQQRDAAKAKAPTLDRSIAVAMMLKAFSLTIRGKEAQFIRIGSEEERKKFQKLAQ